MSQFINWTASKVIERSKRRRRKYLVTCSRCDNKRYLTTPLYCRFNLNQKGFYDKLDF